MHLILSRHGNTFKPEDKPFFVGSGQDLPLVASGLQQANALAEALSKAKISPAAIYTGPLLRTNSYGKMIKDYLKLSIEVVVDKRLNELDYGDWGGLSDDQIVERFGKEKFDDWAQRSIWPEGCAWGDKEENVMEAVQSFAYELTERHEKHDTVLVISSNGRLRYFLTLLVGKFAEMKKAGKFKVGTGKICLLEWDGAFKLNGWNLDPAQAFKTQPVS